MRDAIAADPAASAAEKRKMMEMLGRFEKGQVELDDEMGIREIGAEAAEGNEHEDEDEDEETAALKAALGDLDLGECEMPSSLDSASPVLPLQQTPSTRTTSSASFPTPTGRNSWRSSARPNRTRLGSSSRLPARIRGTLKRGRVGCAASRGLTRS